MSKYLKSFVLSLLIAVSVGGNVNAQAPEPLSENEQKIQLQSQEMQKKAQMLDLRTQELTDIEKKKQELEKKLEEEKKIIEDLKSKIAEKKARDAELAQQIVLPLARTAQPTRVISYNSAGNLYDPGYCTWYTKNRRPDLPNNLGNANTWYARAQSMGIPTGSTPRVGAIATTTEGQYGHTAYVEGVSADGLMVTISEMNYNGLYNMNTRTVSASLFLYIYKQ